MTRNEQLEKLNNLKAYEVLNSVEIKDLDSLGVQLRHKKTGARVTLLINEEENKVFCIGFRTPPTDSTGVAHIIEHSVLCGSDRYPVKDPFIELAKGSLNTFLNAMTYPDKTVYPVASCNDTDFKNLVDVYLDAVFHPNIYHEEKIFKQEGWHYELESAEDELKINGVVYNEMKGAFSSPDDVVSREQFNGLFPDTSYGVESGGDPDVIPELTYENFIDFHSRYYHPSNSYIYLYGDLDMAERLEYIDETYLSTYERLDIDSSIAVQKPFGETRYVSKQYPIAESDSEKEHTYLTYSCVLSDNNLDQDKYLAFDILDYALCSAPGAPIRKALIDAGIGKDVYSEYENGILQPYYSIVAKDTDKDKQDQFVEIIERILHEQADGALDHTSLLAALNSAEFRYREADFGSYPKGLMLGLQMYDSWLYDETKPFLHIVANDTFARLKSYIDTGYYENLIKEHILSDAHKLVLAVEPKCGLTTKKDNELAKKLAEYKATLDESQIEALVKATHELAEYQETEDTPEKLAVIPLLTRADLKKKAAGFILEERKIGDVPVLFHDIFTNGIGYIRLVFDLTTIPSEYWSYLGLYKSFIGLMNTDKHTYGELFNEMNLLTGGIAPVTNVYHDANDPNEFKITFDIKGKVMYEHLGDAVRLMQEMMLDTVYNDKTRIFELVQETKSHVQGALMSAGHNVAAGEATASFSVAEATSAMMGGIPFLRMLEKLESDFDSQIDTVIDIMNELEAMIFRPENLLIDYTGSEESYEELSKYIPGLVSSLHTETLTKTPGYVQPVPGSKAYTSASQVQYVARCGNFRDAGLAYNGALKALKVMMGYDYLWNQVRVRGGAYGCMCMFRRNGRSFFVSYRDPNLDRTVEVYEKAAEYVRNFDADERTMTQYIIGAVADLDIPKTPAAKGLYALNAYLTGTTEAMIQRDRDELLACTPEIIRSLADYIEAFMATGAYCVLGGEEKINASADSFDHIEPLFGC